MPTNHSGKIFRPKSIVIILCGTLLLLAFPLLGMQFSEEITWDIPDFVIMAMLLIVTGLTYEFAVNRVKSKNHRVIIGLILFLLLLYIWVELAVGVFTNIGS